MSTVTITDDPAIAPWREDKPFIENCAFEPSRRPPLKIGGETGNTLLDMSETMIVVALGHLPNNGEPLLWWQWFRVTSPHLGMILPRRSIRMQSVRDYTGPITPAMWAVIRKYWA